MNSQISFWPLLIVHQLKGIGGRIFSQTLGLHPLQKVLIEGIKK